MAQNEPGIRCPSGHAVVDGAKFCPECGDALVGRLAVPISTADEGADDEHLVVDHGIDSAEEEPVTSHRFGRGADGGSNLLDDLLAHTDGGLRTEPWFPTSGARRDSADSKMNKRGIGVIAGVLLMLLVAVLAIGGLSGHNVKADDGASTPTTMSAERIAAISACERRLVAVVTDQVAAEAVLGDWSRQYGARGQEPPASAVIDFWNKFWARHPGFTADEKEVIADAQRWPSFGASNDEIKSHADALIHEYCEANAVSIPTPPNTAAPTASAPDLATQLTAKPNFPLRAPANQQECRERIGWYALHMAEARLAKDDDVEAQYSGDAARMFDFPPFQGLLNLVAEIVSQHGDTGPAAQALADEAATEICARA